MKTSESTVIPEERLAEARRYKVHSCEREKHHVSLKNKLVGGSKEFVNLLNKVNKIAPHNCIVRIAGGTGTGKTELAKHIHNKSNRLGKFVHVNCSAISEALIESELFGYRKGYVSNMSKSACEMPGD